MAILSVEALALAGELHDTSSAFQTLCKKWLNESMFIIFSKRPDWAFLEAEGELITVVDQQAYTYATDFGNADLHKITSLRTEDGQNIRLVTMEEIEKYNSTSGVPTMAGEWAGTMKLEPTPSEVMTIGWRGWARQAELGDDDEPPFESTYIPIWRMGAMAKGLHYLDDARAAQMFALYDHLLTDMFGDNGIEDEEIVCENFSSAQRRTYGINMNDGSVWP